MILGTPPGDGPRGFSYNGGVPQVSAPTNPTRDAPIVGPAAVVAYVMIGILSLFVLLMKGAGGALPDRVASALFVTLDSGWVPALYLLGALGLGKLSRPLLTPSPTGRVIELGVGLTLTLSLTHLLGMLGLLRPMTAWGITGIGLALLLPDARSGENTLSDAVRHARLSVAGVAVLIGCVLVVLMACNPPGALWDSEYGAYDALSYHLQLPREWIEAGRIWPSDHNVYSFLPGYIEGAYAHMALMTGGNLLDGHARAAMSAQLFSAFMLIISAPAMGALSRRVIALRLPGAGAPAAVALSRALTLGTPWLIVVGSLAYNEMGVVLLGLCALSVAIETEISPRKRAILVALIAGGACSCKPTALFLLVPTLAVALLASMPRRRWLSTIVLGAIVGALTIAPWLMRNEIAAGNPVFPQLAGVLGAGRWTPAQHALYAGAHHFSGSPLDRFRFLLLPDPAGIDTVSRWRGFTNPQWGLTPWIALAGLIILLSRRRTHLLGAVGALALLLPVLAWMALTHLQSRFLIPLAPALIVAASIGIASIPTAVVREGLARAIAVLGVGWSILIALSQSGGNPFNLIDLGPGVFTGEIELPNAPWTATLNRVARPGDTIYLLGDATPFYVRSPVLYNTVYDRWCIQDAIEAHPEDPGAWSRSLKDDGVELVVVGFSEIDRFARSGWLPGSIDPQRLIAWIDALGQPIEVWSDPNSNAPIRAVFRLP